MRMDAHAAIWAVGADSERQTVVLTGLGGAADPVELSGAAPTPTPEGHYLATPEGGEVAKSGSFVQFRNRGGLL